MAPCLPGQRLACFHGHMWCQAWLQIHSNGTVSFRASSGCSLIQTHRATLATPWPATEMRTNGTVSSFLPLCFFIYLELGSRGGRRGNRWHCVTDGIFFSDTGQGFKRKHSGTVHYVSTRAWPAVLQVSHHRAGHYQGWVLHSHEDSEARGI